MSWYHAGVVLLFLVFFMLLLRALLGSWSHMLCVFIYQRCDWRWHCNEPQEMDPGVAMYSRDRLRWVGVYRCSRCPCQSIGAARWEQRTREIPHGDVPRLASVEELRENFDRQSS